MILKTDDRADLEGRIGALEQEVYLLKKLLNDALNRGKPISKPLPDGQSDPHVEDADDSWYTDHGHGD